MKVTVLGCGSASGLPLIGNDWGKCDPDNPRNRRTRASVLVEVNDQSILIDTSPDMRQQLLHRSMHDIAAVLYTHAHADHCHGIDELRTVNWQAKRAIPIYADAETLGHLTQRFPYIFGGEAPSVYYKPAVEVHAITGVFDVAGQHIIPFVQQHGTENTLGFRLGDFAYSTDVNRLDDAAFVALEGVKVWVVDCIREEEHHTHSHLAQTLAWIARVKPERAYLTHMNATLDYEALLAKCPPGVWPAYDGLVIEC